jgi:hypothetical protein
MYTHIHTHNPSSKKKKYQGKKSKLENPIFIFTSTIFLTFRSTTTAIISRCFLPLLPFPSAPTSLSSFPLSLPHDGATVGFEVQGTVCVVRCGVRGAGCRVWSAGCGGHTKDDLSERKGEGEGERRREGGRKKIEMESFPPLLSKFRELSELCENT